jgi:UDP-3-O-[3-hydroxymyristoyl] glucosamine N-acyltransferase
MRLADYVDAEALARDGVFETLGHVESPAPGTLAFCDKPAYVAKAAANGNVSCVLTTADLVDRTDPRQGVAVCTDPRTAFYRLHNRLLDEGRFARVGEGSVGEDCTIHPSAVVSRRARIGNGVRIMENAVVKDDVVIGDGTFVDAGVVIGCEGLLYVTEDGHPVPVRHAGGVRIGRKVTLLAGAVVVRSIHDSVWTTVGDHSIIGVRSTIGHEGRVGRDCVILGNCVVARGARIRDGAWIGSTCVIRQYTTVGERAEVMAGSIVVKDVAPGAKVSGNFAVDHNKHVLAGLRMER